MKLHINCIRTIVALIWLVSSIYSQRIHAAAPQLKLFISLNVYLKGALPNDTIMLSLANDILFASHPEKQKMFYAMQNKQGFFQFKVPVGKSFGFFSLSKQRKKKRPNFEGFVSMINRRFWEAGDSLTLNIEFTETALGGGAKTQYSGKGSEKYNLIEKLNEFQLDSAIKVMIPDHWPEKWDGNILAFPNFDSVPTLTKEKLDFLEKNRFKLSDLCYNVLKANLLYEGKSGVMDWLSGTYIGEGKFARLDDNTKKRFIDRFNTAFDPIANYGISEEALAKSFEFTKFLHAKFITASYLQTGEYTLDYIYKAINEYPISQEIRTTLIMLFLWAPPKNAENLNALYANAQKVIFDAEYQEILREFGARIPGRRFTAFKLVNSKGGTTTLSQMLGKVVLIDFWFTGCGHCQKYYQNVLSKAEDKFKDKSNVAFISISIDKDDQVWKRSIVKNIYTNPRSTNLYTNGQGSDHSIIVKNNIAGFPCVVLLNKSGEIVFFNSGNLHNEKGLVDAINALL